MTAAAIAGVLLAGTAAVAANIGILNAADSSAIGELAVTDELLPTAGGDINAPAVPTTTVVTTPPNSGVQRYAIENTGTVWIMTTTSGLALDHVAAEAGWTPVLSQNDLRSLRVDFTNGDRTIVFTAELAADGSVVADVTEPTTVVADSAANDGATEVSTIDDHDADHDEDDHDEDDHEGADDDD